MYVCLCNSLRESDLEDAIARGARSGEEALEILDCDPDCGSCLDFADWFVTEKVSARASVPKS